MDLNKDYRLQRSLREILSVPTEVRAIPTTEDAVAAHVSGRAAESAEAEAGTMSRELRNKKLSEIVRRSGILHNLGREELAESTRQSDILRELESQKLAEGVREPNILREMESKKLAEGVRESNVLREMEYKELAESVRQKAALRELGYSELDIYRVNREAMKSLGRKATGIELANIVGTGIAAHKKLQAQQKQAQQIGELTESNKRLLEIKREYYNKLMKTY